MNLRVQRRIASEVLKCGVNRVWFDPEHLDEVARAITREDIRRFIDKGFIRKAPEKGTSRARARKIAEKKRKGRRVGHGRRKGKKNARFPKKERWMVKIRAQRKYLRALREAGEITKKLYRRLYRRAKGGIFRSKAHLQMQIDQIKGGKKE